MLSAAGEITDPARHVDGEETLDMPYGVTRDSNGSCTGECHNENHNNDSLGVARRSRCISGGPS